MADDLTLPDFLRISAEERRRAWELAPPKPMPEFAGASPELSKEFVEFAQAENERKAMKSRARIRKMLQKKQSVDLTTHHWDARNNRFTPNSLYKSERNMRPDFNSMAGPELIMVYKEMAVEAAGLELPVSIPKRFENRAVGLRRCEELYNEIATKKGSEPTMAEQPPAEQPTPAQKPPKTATAKADKKTEKGPSDPLSEECGVREGSKQFAILKFLKDKQGELIPEREIVEALGVLPSRIRVTMKVMNKGKFELKAEKDDKGEISYGLHAK